MSDPSLSMAAAATRSLPSSPVKNNPKHYPPSVTQSAYHHRRHLSHDLEDDDEASCSDLYVNQRDIQEAVRLRPDFASARVMLSLSEGEPGGASAAAKVRRAPPTPSTGASARGAA